MSRRMAYPVTPDGGYFVVRGAALADDQPGPPEAERVRLVKALSQARAAFRRTAATTKVGRAEARKRVNDAKVGLGERGPVWWAGDAPYYNRRMAVNTPYRDWFAALPAGQNPDESAE